MKKTPTQSGFSLVETLVAITILLLVIVGPMTISSSTAKSTTFASEQVTAFFLAQEGAELIQKVRDELLLENLQDTNPDPNVFSSANPDPWTDFINTTSGPLSACYAGSGCGAVINTNTTGTLATLRSCATITDCALYLDTTTSPQRSRYVHSVTTTPTPFTRVIRLSRTGNEVSVISTVTWRSGFSRNEQQVSVQTSLFNVYGNI